MPTTMPEERKDTGYKQKPTQRGEEKLTQRRDGMGKGVWQHKTQMGMTRNTREEEYKIGKKALTHRSERKSEGTRTEGKENMWEKQGKSKKVIMSTCRRVCQHLNKWVTSNMGTRTKAKNSGIHTRNSHCTAYGAQGKRKQLSKGGGRGPAKCR